jgi:hypothetical protein
VVLHEADAPVLAGEVAVTGARSEIFRKCRAIRLEAGRVDVRDVVGDDIDLVAQRHLPRQADKKCILHR